MIAVAIDLLKQSKFIQMIKQKEVECIDSTTFQSLSCRTDSIESDDKALTDEMAY